MIDTIAFGDGPTGVAVNPTTNRIYVTPAFDEVWVVDGTTNTVVDTIPVGSGPAAIGVDPTTHRIYVANTFSNSVSVIDGSPPTPTPTDTPTETPTPTITSTPTSTPATTSTATSTATPTATPTLSPTPTPPPPPPSAPPPAPAPAHIDWAPRIAIVWPHGSASTSQTDAPLVNVGVWPSVAVPCQVDPTPPIELFVARNHEPASRVGSAPRLVERTVGEARFPSLEFDDVPTSLSANPNARDTFFSVVDGQPVGNVWVHAADPRTIFPQPLTPTGYGAASPPAVDVRIQIVWPHDAAGVFAPVDRATQVNVAIDLFVHGTTVSVPPEAEYPVQLWWARGNDPLTPAPFAVQKVTYEVNGQAYARWVVNNVPVEPGEVYHFLATAGPLGDGGTSYATVWTHAADGRAFLPHPQVPPSCAS